jgi:hypothetical protein
LAEQGEEVSIGSPLHEHAEGLVKHVVCE